MVNISKKQTELQLMNISQTSLQKFEFGDEPSDQFYCLIDLRVSPKGLSIEEIKLTDPRNIDKQFREKGCLMLFTGDEIEELLNRGEISREKVHRGLYDLAVREGVIAEGE
jgi:hypothetical protein